MVLKSNISADAQNLYSLTAEFEEFDLLKVEFVNVSRKKV